MANESSTFDEDEEWLYTALGAIGKRPTDRQVEDFSHSVTELINSGDRVSNARRHMLQQMFGGR